MSTRAQKRLKVEDNGNDKMDVVHIPNEEESNYERIRLENIRRNQEFLATLGLDDDRSALVPVKSTVPTKRGGNHSYASRLAQLQRLQPVRRSGRVTIERIKLEIEDLKKNGGSQAIIDVKEKELEEMLSKKAEGSYDVNTSSVGIMSDTPISRLHSDPISLFKPINFNYEKEGEGDNHNNDNDDSMVTNIVSNGLMRTLTTISQHPKKRSSSSSASLFSSASSTNDSLSNYIARLNKLSISENDVAKLTEARITSVYCHPSQDKILVAAGDKAGFIGLWDIDDLSGSHGGVYRYRPHVETIIKLHSYTSDPTSIYSVSYDGTIRSTNIQQSAFTQVFEVPESFGDMIVTDASFYPTLSSAMIVSRSDGYVCLVDFRKSNKSYGWKASIADSKLNSVQIFPSDENYLISTIGGKDGFTHVHDIRKIGSNTKPLKSFDLHTKSINAAYTTPDGAYLVSISQDNTIRTWKDPVGVSSSSSSSSSTSSSSSNVESVVTRHDNHTGRWLSTFRPAFDPKQPSVFLTGSMDRPRRIEVFGITSTGSTRKTSGSSSFHVSLAKAFQGDYLGSVCSRCCFHPTLNMIIGGNSSGRVHVFR